MSMLPENRLIDAVDDLARAQRMMNDTLSRIADAMEEQVTQTRRVADSRSVQADGENAGSPRYVHGKWEA